MKIQDPIYKLPLMTPQYVDLFAKLGVNTIENLLYHFPRNYFDTRDIVKFSELQEDSYKTVFVEVIKSTPIYTKYGKKMVQTTLRDEDNNMAEVLWFGQTFMMNVMKANTFFLVYTKLLKATPRKYTIEIKEYEEIKDGRNPRHLEKITPIYPETKGLSSKYIRSKILPVLDQIRQGKIELAENLSGIIRLENDLLDIKSAIVNIHFPNSFEYLERAKYRLAFDEIRNILLQVEDMKKGEAKYRSNPIKLIDPIGSNISAKEFLSQLSQHINLKFEPTDFQKKVIIEILEDISKMKPMSRLLQGDVGAGKTLVAVAIALAVAQNNLDTIIIAPTTILAEQHYKSFQAFFEGKKVEIHAITGNNKSLTVAEKSNKPKIIIGTHAVLYQHESLFKQVGLLIVDEQHRFGVEQREKILNIETGKNKNIHVRPHYLQLTATPIPRSIAQVYYSNMDISNLLGKPGNRQKIDTHIVPEAKRLDCYKFLQKEIANGGQAYILCPLVETSEKMDLKNVKKEFEDVSKIFAKLDKNIQVGILHGKMKAKEKEAVLQEFKDNKLQVLVTTQVIEVGIDIPNSNIILIESAERFGLAQLHQLRGRVGRGSRKSYCFLFLTPTFTEDSPDINNDALSFDSEEYWKEMKSKNFKSKKKRKITARERLEFFSKTEDGFALSEFDMVNRGTGDLAGSSQSGMPKLKLANIFDMELVSRVKKTL